MSRSYSIGEKTTAEADAETAVDGGSAILVCADANSPSYFDDDEYGECACGQEIRWRPTAPKNADRVCGRCAFIDMSKRETAGKNSVVVVTKEAVAEAERVLGVTIRKETRQ